MQRHLILVVIGFVFSIGTALAAPARPLYEPAPPAKAPAPAFVNIDLNNSVWLGKYNASDRVFVFEADSTLSYRPGNLNPKLANLKALKGRGSWRQQGDIVTFEHFITPGNKIMEFRGKIVDANTIVGEATYPRLGTKAPQTMKRATPDAK